MLTTFIKHSIVLAAIVLSVCYAEEGQEQPVVVYSKQITDLEDSSECTVHQGEDLTLVACDGGYELYATNALAMHAKGITNYGETKIASAVGTSLALNKDGHLTYLVDGKHVVTAYWDEEAESVEKAIMLELDLPSGEVATDLFVFDDIVAIRVESGNFKFFTIPLVAGQVSLEIPSAAPTNETEADLF